jgi:hypothetical protein
MASDEAPGQVSAVQSCFSFGGQMIEQRACTTWPHVHDVKLQRATAAVSSDFGKEWMKIAVKWRRLHASELLRASFARIGLMPPKDARGSGGATDYVLDPWIASRGVGTRGA